MRMSRYTEQTAVYWPLFGMDSQGNKEFGDPVEFKCRWEDLVEEFLDGKGERVISRSKVMYDPLLIEIEIGGLVILSELADLPYPNDPWDDENGQVLEVRQKQKIPDRRARKFVGFLWV